MNKLIKKGYISIFALLILAACEGKEQIDYGQGTESGKLEMKLDIDVKVVAKAPVALEDYIVKVMNATTKQVAKDINGTEASYAYGKVPAIITLPIGEYYVEALSHEMKGAEFDKPCYKGESKTFTITKETIQQVSDILCTQQNIAVTVKYSDILKKELKSYSTTITNGLDGGVLIFDETESRVGYFAIPESNTLTVRLTGIRKNGDEITPYTEKLTNLDPKDIRDLEMTVKVQGKGEISLSVNSSINQIDKDIDIPVTEPTIPDTEDPSDPETKAPSIKGVGFDITQVISYPIETTKNVVVDMEAEAGIKELWVEIDSPFLTEEMLLSVDLAKKFNLADLSPDMKDAIYNKLELIETDPVRGAKSLQFNITRFTSMLLTTDKHNFILTLTDNKDRTETQSLMMKPFR